MKPILMMPYSNALAHTVRLLSLARELRRAGYPIVCAGGGTYTRMIMHEGFDTRYLHETPYDTLFGAIEKGAMRFVCDEELRRCVEADLNLYYKVDPQLVISDGRFSAPISAQLFGVKHGAISSVSSTSYRAIPYVPLLGKLTDIAADTRFGRFLNVCNVKFEQFVFDHVMDLFTKLSREARLAKEVTATNCLEGVDFTLLADVPGFMPARALPEDVYFVGPIGRGWRAESGNEPVLSRSAHTQPIIYVTIGSTGSVELVRHIVSKAGEHPYTCIISGVDPREFPRAPRNVHIYRSLNGEQACARADAVICHGGGGTVYQALAAGKPFIGIPSNPDQRFYTRRARQLKAARLITYPQLRASDELLWKTLACLLKDDTYAKSARALSEQMVGYSSAGRLVDVIAKYADPVKKPELAAERESKAPATVAAALGMPRN